MLETAIALGLAHLVADFVLQPDRLVAAKRDPARRWRALLLHGLIVAAASWAALGLAPAPGLIALTAGLHLVIDRTKLAWGGPGFAGFAADQAAHGGAIWLGAALWPAAYGSGLWGLPVLAPSLGLLPTLMTVAGGGIAAVVAGGFAVQAITRDFAIEDPASLAAAGRLIGRLERALILLFVLVGQPDGIGFLIAAKSLLRFGEMAREHDRRVSEYVIIGTLASFGWGLGVAFGTHAILAALHP
ncbi:MAG: DUF3307 domain-containing protein [Amaricoccus sp.]|uniref:DUF3307 domain-containing protein n=1 Tax=Amaricoccus sp. TaxID=1872485 RepID=UPI0039E6E792